MEHACAVTCAAIGKLEIIFRVFLAKKFRKLTYPDYRGWVELK